MSLLLLDLRTLFIALASVNVVLSIIMLLLLRTRKTYPGFGLWTLSYWVNTLGFFLIALRGLIPDALTIVLANALILTGLALILEGTRRFRGVSARWGLSVTPILILVLAQYYFTFITDDMGIRIVLYSLLSALLSGCIAWELLTHAPAVKRFSFLFAGTVFVLHALLMLTRLVVTLAVPAGHDFLAPNYIQTATFLSGMLLSIASAFGFVMLNSERLEADLQAVQVELQRMAKTDFLTGIANSRSFLEAGKRELLRKRRYDRPLAVLLLDLDHFKDVNDTYGHAVGDRVLVAVSAVCKELLRDIDVFGRIGGEEFALLLPETDLTGGRATAERLRTAVAETPIDTGPVILHQTISIGVSEMTEDDASLETALKRADDAMYRAKQEGRNRVEVFSRERSANGKT